MPGWRRACARPSTRVPGRPTQAPAAARGRDGTVAVYPLGENRHSGGVLRTTLAPAQVDAKTDPVVFVLWGGYARKKRALITGRHHVVLESVHPSPLSAHNGFLGSRPFSRANAALEAVGREPIDWRIPDR